MRRAISVDEAKRIVMLQREALKDLANAVEDVLEAVNRSSVDGTEDEFNTLRVMFGRAKDALR